MPEASPRGEIFVRQMLVDMDQLEQKRVTPCATLGCSAALTSFFRWKGSCVQVSRVTLEELPLNEQIFVESFYILLLKESESHSVVSDSLRPHGLYSPWNSLGQNTGVGSLSLHQELNLEFQPRN